MPINLNYNFNLGILLVVSVVVLIITGLFSILYIVPSVNDIFISLFSDFYFIFSLRTAHNIFANFLFLLLYLHIFKSWFISGIYQVKVFSSGIILFVLFCAVAFLGYCLPLGQMSYWACIVILNLVTILPFGNTILLYIMGGFSISSRTLMFLFVLHYLLPLVSVIIIAAHFYLLHINLSSSSLGYFSSFGNTSFFLNYVLVDMYFVALYFVIIFILLFWYPYSLFEHVNWIKAMPLVTPIHIFPDWFFYFAYACLRSVESKVIGLILLIFSMFTLFLPFFLPIKSNLLNYWFVVSFLILSFLGSCVAFSVYLYAVLLLSFLWFSSFTLIVFLVINYYDTLLL